MMQFSRSWKYFLAGIVLLAIVALSSSVSNLEFRKGTLFNHETKNELSFLFLQFIEYRGVLLTCVAIIPLVILVFTLLQQTRYQQISSVRRNNVLVILIQLIFFLLAFLVIRRKLLEAENNPFDIGPLEPPQIPISAPLGRLYVEIPPLLAFLVGVSLLSMIFLLFFWYSRSQRRSINSINKIRLDALSAIRDIEKGLDLRNVIIRCYYEMNRTVEISRGVTRPDGMTPREFEKKLVEMGLPKLPVSQLTRLFEEVRYGGKLVEDELEETAKSCLSAIALECQVSK